MENILENNTVEELLNEVRALKAHINTMQWSSASELEDKSKFIALLHERHKSELEDKNQDIKALKEEINKLHYTIKGISSEYLSIRMEVSPHMIAQTGDTYELANHMTRQANSQMAAAVEKQLGDRYILLKEYDRAIRHIYYLENQARAFNVGFESYTYSVVQKFK